MKTILKPIYVFINIILISVIFNTIILAQSPDTLWTKTYGGIGNDVANSLQITSEEGYIICGTTTSFGAGSHDVWLIKTDSNGDTLWTKTFGGNDSDFGKFASETMDNGFIVTGGTKSYGSGSDDVWLIKTDNNGDTLWTKTYGANEGDWGNSVHQTFDGGYIITGVTGQTNENDHDILLIKTDSVGSTLWTKTLAGVDRDRGLSVQQTQDSGYIITGEINGIGRGVREAFLMKTNSTGDSLWVTSFNESGYYIGEFVQQTSDGGYILTGATQTPFYNVWLVKTDSLGNILWRKDFDAGGSWGTSVQQTSDGGFIIASSATGTG